MVDKKFLFLENVVLCFQIAKKVVQYRDSLLLSESIDLERKDHFEINRLY